MKVFKGLNNLSLTWGVGHNHYNSCLTHYTIQKQRNTVYSTVTDSCRYPNGRNFWKWDKKKSNVRKGLELHSRKIARLKDNKWEEFKYFRVKSNRNG